MGRQGDSVRTGVLVLTSLALTAQFFALLGSIVFYLYASSETYRDNLSREIFTRLYHRTQWNWLRRSKALEFHIMISCAVQVFLLLPSICLIIGASKRLRFLLLPWLMIFGLFQLAIFVGIFFAVFSLPSDYKLVSVAIVAVEAFLIFPWWYSVIHLFAVFTNQEEVRESAIATAGSGGSAATAVTPNWRFGDGNSYSLGARSSTTKMSEV